MVRNYVAGAEEFQHYVCEGLSSEPAFAVGLWLDSV